MNMDSNCRSSIVVWVQDVFFRIIWVYIRCDSEDKQNSRLADIRWNSSVGTDLSTTLEPGFDSRSGHENPRNPSDPWLSRVFTRLDSVTGITLGLIYSFFLGLIILLVCLGYGIRRSNPVRWQTHRHQRRTKQDLDQIRSSSPYISIVCLD